MSSYPSVINDFIVTVKHEREGARVRQFTLENTSSLSVEYLEPGNYNLQIANHSSTELYGQCWTEFDVGAVPNPAKVSVASFEVSDYNGFQITCKDSDDGTITVHPSGGTGTYTEFQWTPEISTTETAHNLAEGTYKVRLKDSNNCWSEEYQQGIDAPEKLVVALESTGGKGGFDVSCSNKRDGAVSTIASGGVPQYMFRWSTGTTTPNLISADTGTYHLDVTDANGCMASADLTLNAPESIDFSINEISGINCPGNKTGVLEVGAVINTIGEVYYSWSTGETEKEITGKGPGEYSLTISDQQGCQQTRFKTLHQPAAYTVQVAALSDFNGSPIRCHGEANGKLTATVRDEHQNIVTPENYSWYRNDTEFIVGGASHSFLNTVSAGTYTLRIRYRNICEAETTFRLPEPEPVAPLILIESDFNGTPISCHGASDGSLSVRISGGTGDTYTWQWNSGERGPTLTGLSAGNYSVIAADENGCTGMAEKILNEPRPVEATITTESDYNGQPLTCANASDARLRGSATGGNPPFATVWNTGNVGPDLSDVPAGSYSFKATDANGCSALAEMEIINPVPVKAEITEASDFHGFGVSCHDDEDGFLLATGFGGTGSYTYDWNDGDYTLARYDGLAPGRYTLRVADQNGCHDRIEAEITEPAPLIVEVSETTNVSCNDGTDGEIRLSPRGGAGDYQFATAASPWQGDPVLTSLKAGTHHVILRDANGCEQSVFQDLTEPTPLSIVFEDLEAALCGDPRGRVSSRVTGGSGDYVYKWSDAQGLPISDEPNIYNLVAGIYTLSVTDANACQENQSLAISSTDGPQVRIAELAAPSCSYTRDGSALLEVTQGNGPFTFHWTDGQQTTRAINLGEGNHFVEIRDANDCSTILSVPLAAPDSLVVKPIATTEPTCNAACNGKVVVAAQGGNGTYSYLWDDAIGAQRDQLCAGEYHLVASDEKGCLTETTIIMKEPEALEIGLSSLQPPVCTGSCDGVIAVKATGGSGPIEYVWSTGMNTPLITDLCAGSYSLTVVDENRCTMQKTFVINNPPEPQLDLGGGVTLCEGQTHILDPGNFWSSYSWTSNNGFSSEDQRIIIATSGLYALEAVTMQGCIARDTFFLETSRDLLKANFLLASEALVSDTIVAIDISWPLPESSIWRFPDEMDRLVDNGDVVYGIFDHAGYYKITLSAILGQCRDEMTKNVNIIGNEDHSDEGRLGHEPFVKEFALYPNPNDGMFNIRIVLKETSAIALTIWNTLTAMKIAQYEGRDQREYEVNADLRPLSAGNYTVRLDYTDGSKYLRFMVK